ncbi:MAG TPA: UDP-N-acetylmuramoyl-L-alanyl-D-glutamate--2,6-diaminopimelate ligase [Rhodanobacteraceae bacterium]|nr:UDP-N-acetylmuramoyl-L-alanyl-D-glutamate--2,6-diaminopimelate ligase [Rhodanobacteraceae bacterium]
MSAMRLDDLLRGVAAPVQADIVVSGLTLDSRSVRAGDAFVALAGAKHHGIEFAEAAVARGAVVVLAERPGPETGGLGPKTPASSTSVSSAQTAALDTNLYESRKNPVTPVFGPRSPVPGPVLWIDNLRTHLGEIAARFFDDPSVSLRVIGVTGTSGKTSIVQLLAQALAHLGHRAATIGTLGAGLHGALRVGERTTPDVIRVHGLLAEFRGAGASHVAMEVSSHALDQHRVDGVHFDVAVFTNLTRDHLDYHGTMEAYGAAKSRLFGWPDLDAAVINVDDAFGRVLAARLPGGVQLLRYGIDSADADIRAQDVHTHSSGIDFELAIPGGTGKLRSRLLGRFNVANLLAVAGTLAALGVPFKQICAALEALQPISGRMNRLGGGGLPLVVVDYSHKPDALEQVLTTLRAHCEGKLVCVFGCGGERDAGKRPLMGAIAERFADVVVVTDDNPRGEDGDAIVAQIIAGMQAPEHVAVERDRARAIDLAIAQAQPGDVVLIAGKGHETYQEVAGSRRPFDDLSVARATLEAHAC